mmetsp:Transcript_26218/g.57259  ORF Transcript_26218/g.57259 Transcript_26218/m.57259 type:complete len:324 (-) Transcript_26218:1020-1991(-)|eukprot:CAMPEP_0202890870 /NCGR_PEP_ID=MMETSP1392-20130828/1138_1 /ASSEMBLY_ACC=CAM_ASM_000868 /TAXON_ID=225041 /ORGANISM="Chlamydomonas chlamydogama, Strain SAG 11-48b" /LENGTH=323 /DNA_ID=CAMNT_0049574517 /DNA_START=157 /DNA_END=1128 /DNA_ORIENTATION=+
MPMITKGVNARDAEQPEETQSLLRSTAETQQDQNEEGGSNQEGAEGHTPSVDSAVASPSKQLPPVPAQAASGASASSLSSEGRDALGPKETGICRICLEEDHVSKLEHPCGCSGTQRFAHHACIQRWVEEKGNIRCEVCAQEYQGDYHVPPEPATPADAMPVLTPLYIVDPETGRARAMRHNHNMDMFDDNEQYYQRHTGLSCVFTGVIFILFLVVLHHTMVVTDNMAYGDDTSATDPAATPDMSGADDYSASLTLFLFWVGTKAFLIGIPLWTILRIAARQARREQYEAMLRSGAMDNRRIVFRFRTVQRGDAAPPRGLSAV